MNEELVDTINEKSGYQCLLRLLDKVAERAEAMDWDELEEMLVSQTNSFAMVDDKAMFEKQYLYLIRLNLRIKYYSEKAPLNVVRIDDSVREGDLTITNYDYKTFCWAVDSQLMDELDNNVLRIPKDSIPQAVYQHFYDMAINKPERPVEQKAEPKSDLVKSLQDIFGSGVEEIK